MHATQVLSGLLVVQFLLVLALVQLLQPEAVRDVPLRQQKKMRQERRRFINQQEIAPSRLSHRLVNERRFLLSIRKMFRKSLPVLIDIWPICQVDELRPVFPSVRLFMSCYWSR